MEDIFKPKALLLHYSIFLPSGVCISLLLDIFHCDLCFTRNMFTKSLMFTRNSLRSTLNFIYKFEVLYVSPCNLNDF